MIETMDTSRCRNRKESGRLGEEVVVGNKYQKKANQGIIRHYQQAAAIPATPRQQHSALRVVAHKPSPIGP
jgi:hypothetical protein